MVTCLLTLLAKRKPIFSKLKKRGGDVASRKASQNAINSLQPLLPELLGGSADLAGSNLTLFKGAKGIEEETLTATISITVYASLV